MSFEVTLSDDTPVDCAGLSVENILVHDQHGHSLSTAQGCTGSFTTELDAGHAGAGNLFLALRATYTDRPVEPGVPPLTTQRFALLFPTPEAPDAPPPDAPTP